MVIAKEARIIQLTTVTGCIPCGCFNSNPGSLMTLLKKVTGRAVKNPEAVNSVMRNIKRPTVPR